MHNILHPSLTADSYTCDYTVWLLFPMELNLTDHMVYTNKVSNLFST